MANSTWGGTQISDCTEITISDDFTGQQYIVASGAMVSDSIASKRQINLRWELVATSMKNTLYTKATTNASAALVLSIPDATSNIETYTVTPIRRTFQATPIGTTPHWNVSCTVRET